MKLIPARILVINFLMHKCPVCTFAWLAGFYNNKEITRKLISRDKGMHCDMCSVLNVLWENPDLQHPCMFTLSYMCHGHSLGCS